MPEAEDTEEEHPSNQTCPFCKGTGRCFKCDGQGVRRLKRKYAATCYACEGSGKCQLCHGTGEVPRG